VHYIAVPERQLGQSCHTVVAIIRVSVGLSEESYAVWISLVRSSSWRKVPPRVRHEHPERGIDKRKDPERRFIVQKPLEPVFYEAGRIGGFAGLPPQPGFQDSEWTQLAQPGLGYDNGNRGQVGEAKQ
jgi:hypothetical protein